MVGMTRSGAFAQFMSIPAKSLIDMPQEVSAIHAALTEPAATALHSINMSMKAMARPLPENRTLVIGGGAIGKLAALLLRRYGCQGVVFAETNSLRRASMQQHAHIEAYDPRETPV